MHQHHSAAGGSKGNGAVAAGGPEPDRGQIRFRLKLVLGLNFFYMLVEVAGGLLSGSLALLSDAGHMFTDVAALGLALLAMNLADQPATSRRTFGLLRAEVMGAFLNGASMVLMVGFIGWEAVSRLRQPPAVDGPLMLAVAGAGLLVNAISAWLLAGSRKHGVNLRGAFLHMLADALGSAGAILAGLLILTTGWRQADPMVSILIGGLILWSSAGLLKESLNILLEAVPDHLDTRAVHDALASLPHVEEVHDLHIWTITSGVVALSAHVRLRQACSDTTHWQACLQEAQTLLATRFGIVHSTMQFEPADYQKDDRTI